MKKSFLVLACIMMLSMGLLLFSCQKKEEPATEAVTEEAAPATEEAAPAAEEAPAESSSKEKPATGGY